MSFWTQDLVSFPPGDYDCWSLAFIASSLRQIAHIFRLRLHHIPGKCNYFPFDFKERRLKYFWGEKCHGLHCHPCHSPCKQHILSHKCFILTKFFFFGKLFYSLFSLKRTSRSLSLSLMTRLCKFSFVLLFFVSILDLKTIATVLLYKPPMYSCSHRVEDNVSFDVFHPWDAN